MCVVVCLFVCVRACVCVICALNNLHTHTHARTHAHTHAHTQRTFNEANLMFQTLDYDDDHHCHVPATIVRDPLFSTPRDLPGGAPQ